MTHDHHSHDGRFREHDRGVDGGSITRVQIALALTGVFMVVELIGGILSGSLALLADAGHMLTDTMALGLAAFAFRVSSRPADSRRSFGYHRFQIIAAFVNGLSLLVIVAWILFEAVQRMIDPPDVAGRTMLLIACGGLIVNIAAFFVLHGGDQRNLNIRGAALHVLGDLLGSLAAIIAAIVILQTGWMPIDPILSVLVAALLLRSGWQLVRRSVHILLEGVPDWLDLKELQAKIVTAVPEVVEVHHVHAWGLTPQHPMLTMHVVLQEQPDDPTEIVRRVKETLRTEFEITHSTIEMEIGGCADA
ncbi:MAG: cation diffusion facilitator family transporter [Proteobacteria bacterium]|nr:cation diffusion facilitator family transporter [Pseudomonadota bacterium]MDA0995204.1 cation diffusion facilitator family transporter [Pseudomonadota bacterium]